MSEYTFFTEDLDDVPADRVVNEEQLMELLSKANKDGMLFAFAVVPNDKVVVGVKSNLTSTDDIFKSIAQIGGCSVTHLLSCKDSNLKLMGLFHNVLTGSIERYKDLTGNDLLPGGLTVMKI